MPGPPTVEGFGLSKNFDSHSDWPAAHVVQYAARIAVCPDVGVRSTRVFERHTLEQAPERKQSVALASAPGCNALATLVQSTRMTSSQAAAHLSRVAATASQKDSSGVGVTGTSALHATTSEATVRHAARPTRTRTRRAREETEAIGEAYAIVRPRAQLSSPGATRRRAA